MARNDVLVLIPAFLYVTVFAVHFQLLPNSGPGDAFMSQRFQSTLVGNARYDPAANMSFPDRFIEINDGSSLAGLQIIADGSLPNYETEVKHLTDTKNVSIRTPARGVTLSARRLRPPSRFQSALLREE